MNQRIARRAPVSRVLIVGFGSIGRRHLRVAREVLGNATFAVLRSGTTPPHEDDDSVMTFHSTTDALQFAPDVAVIASPATHHAAVAAELARAGVHLLIEKPVTDRLETAVALRDVIVRAGVVAAVGYNLRHLSSLIAFRGAVVSGRTGRVLNVRAEVGQYLPEWRPDRDYRTSVSAQRTLGGGALLELSHELDYLLWIFGRVASVTAAVRRVSDLDIDVEDSVNLLLEFTALVDSPPLIASVALDFMRRDTVRVCTAVGVDGTLEWDGVRGTVRLYEAATREWRVLHDAPAERDETYRAEWRDLCACIEQGGVPHVDLDAGIAVLQVVDAARRADESRRTVDVALDTHLLTKEV